MTDIDTIARTLEAIDTRRQQRRRFLTQAAGAGIAAGGLSLLAACGSDGTGSASATATATTSANTNADVDVLNFALNLEYLEASYYSWAVFGAGLASSYTTGVGTVGTVTGGAKVSFTDASVLEIATEIAYDELEHVAFLRTVLGGAAVAMPALNIDGSATGAFTAAARAAGVIGASDTFNPYASDEAFLLGAYIFEDVGVSAYKGASPLISDKTFVEAAAGILATEAYHAGTVRTLLNAKGIATPSLITQAQQISDARDSLDGSSDDDQGITGTATVSNIVPADANGIAYSRSTGQVLNIVYLNKAQVSAGGFFPSGLAGNIRTSAASG